MSNGTKRSKAVGLWIRMPDNSLAEAWNKMATSNFSDASALAMRYCWRSALSRAYYAAYARVVAALVRSGITLPARGNPGHTTLQAMILNNLKSLEQGSRGQLADRVEQLRNLRIVADYCPTRVVDQSDVRVSAGLMGRVFADLKGADV